MAHQVRMARAVLDMTIAEFGTLVGLSASTISHIEHGHVTLSRTTDGIEEALRDVPAIEWLPDNGESIGIRFHYSRLPETFDTAARVYGRRQGRGIRRYDPDELLRGMIGSGYPLEKLMKDAADHEARYGRDKRIGKRAKAGADAKVPDASSNTAPAVVVSTEALVKQRIANRENPIRVWREHHEMSLTSLAEKIGIGKGFLSQIETGKRTASPELQDKVARALGIKPEALLPATSTENKSASIPAASAAPEVPIIGPTAPTGPAIRPGLPKPPKPNPPTDNIRRLEHMAQQEGISVQSFIEAMGRVHRERIAEMGERKPRRR